MRVKNWVCLICHRDGEKTTLKDAEREHRELLLAAKQANEFNRRVYGPSAVGTYPCLRWKHRSVSEEIVPDASG